MTKTALITGASRGIGMLSAVELRRRGWRVFAGVRSPDNTPELDAICLETDITVEKVALDVTNAKSAVAAVDQIKLSGCSLELVVNNAGIGCSGFFEQLSEEEFDLVMRTNFDGAVEMIRAILPAMRERRLGTIINISSIYGFMGCPMSSAYAASKWALEGFSESLRFEMEPFGVYVVLVEPGYFRTEFLDDDSGKSKGMYHSGSPYLPAVVGLMDVFRKRVVPTAGDPQAVAKLVASIADLKKPRLRYVAGLDGKLWRLFRSIVPARLFEAIIVGQVAKALKNPSKNAA